MRSIIKEGALKLHFKITDDQICDFIALYDEIEKWGKKINLTALLGDRTRLIEELFLDSIAPLNVIGEGRGGEISLLDIGSGGGFPGIPLKIAKRDLSITLSDSIEKKVFFMRHVIRTLSLKDIEAANVKYGDGGAKGVKRDFYAFAVSKAVTSIENLGTWARPHLAEGGKLLCMKGPRDEAIDLKGYKKAETYLYELPLSGMERKILIYEKC